MFFYPSLLLAIGLCGKGLFTIETLRNYEICALEAGRTPFVSLVSTLIVFQKCLWTSVSVTSLIITRTLDSIVTSAVLLTCQGLNCYIWSIHIPWCWLLRCMQERIFSFFLSHLSLLRQASCFSFTKVTFSELLPLEVSGLQLPLAKRYTVGERRTQKKSLKKACFKRNNTASVPCAAARISVWTGLGICNKLPCGSCITWLFSSKCCVTSTF